MSKQILLLLFLACSAFWAQGQTTKTEIIYLENPSFEDMPRAGRSPSGWEDCGQAGETPPDVQPYGGFNVTKTAQDGSTYLGLVTRDNKTWEAVGQRLSKPLKKGGCYNFSLQLCKSGSYISPTKRDQNKLTNFERGVTIRVWAGNSYCDRAELLDQTDIVDNTYWKGYNMKFNPKDNNYSFIIIEAYYKTPTLFFYNGNILIDNASEISSCNIPLDTDPLASNDPKKINKSPGDNTIDDPLATKDPDPETDPNNTDNNNTTANNENLEDKGNFDPDKIKKEDIKVGQTYRLENLYFPADSSNITRNAEKVLMKLYTFLEKNPGVAIEVGGHTNGLPPDDYCDNLSTNRAKNVEAYLTRHGISSKRITHKGYGKRKPIDSNESKLGRQRNQRVEIKITEVN
ncbi:MAG: OmpA family protein [Aureispira sp.]|nr:OmpA family protein [Aureispira sp.]